MKRRELLAGIGSVGALAGAGALLWRGPPSFGEEERVESARDEDDDGPVEVETIDARGSEAGTVFVPGDEPAVISFFVTGCGQCQAQMPRLAEANRRLDGEDVRFLSVTYQAFDRMPADELREWWASHGGNWWVGYDSDSVLARAFGVVGYPVTVVVDADGERHWRELGVKSADEIVAAVDPVLATERG